MRKILVIALFAFLSLNGFSQKQVVIKGGTIIPVEAISEVRATSVKVGQNVDLQVSRDVIIDGVIAIPAGTIVKSTVFEAKRSLAFGTKGRLGLHIKSLHTKSGDVVTFASSDIYIEGKNRTPLAVIVFVCCYIPLPCGSKAVLKPGIEYEATVATNTTITIQ